MEILLTRHEIEREITYLQTKIDKLGKVLDLLTSDVEPTLVEYFYVTHYHALTKQLTDVILECSTELEIYRGDLELMEV
jgi:hypothetical protein